MISKSLISKGFLQFITKISKKLTLDAIIMMMYKLKAFFKLQYIGEFQSVNFKLFIYLAKLILLKKSMVHKMLRWMDSLKWSFQKQVILSWILKLNWWVFVNIKIKTTSIVSNLSMMFKIMINWKHKLFKFSVNN